MKNKFLQNYAQHFDAVAKSNNVQPQQNVSSTSVIQSQTYTPQQQYISSNNLQIEQTKLAAELESLKITKERIARERQIEEQASIKIDLERKELKLEQEKLNEEQKKLFELKAANNHKAFMNFQVNNEIEALKETLKTEYEYAQLEKQKLLKGYEEFKLSKKTISEKYEKLLSPVVIDNKKALNEMLKDNQEKLKLTKEKADSEKYLLRVEQERVELGQLFIEKEFDRLDKIINSFLDTSATFNLEETDLLGNLTYSND